MKKYAEYKESEFEGFDVIPSHWEIKKTKWLFSEINVRNRDQEFSETDLLSVSEYYGVALRKDKIKADDILKRADSLDENKKVKVDDLVINIMLAWKKGLGVSPYKGIVSPSYSVFRLISDGNSRYFHYLYRTDFYADYFKRYSKGIIYSRLRMYPEEFFKTSTILPSSDEQTAIANFLDLKTQQIDDLIAKKERLIELLKEERTAVINQAVTKGLDPDVPMKDSGIEWLGEIPEHWTVKRLRFLVKNIIEKSSPNGFKIALENIESGTGRYITPEKSSDLSGDMNVFKKGDVLFNKLRPYLAKVFLPQEEGTSVGELLVLRPEFGMDSKFLFYRMLSRDFIEIVNSSTYGAKMPRASWEDFIRNLIIPFPEVQEQKEIVLQIEKNVNGFNNSISKLVREIKLFREYKTSLINEAVTGKIDVRE